MAGEVKPLKSTRVREVARITALARWRVYGLIARGQGPKRPKVAPPDTQAVPSHCGAASTPCVE